MCLFRFNVIGSVEGFLEKLCFLNGLQYDIGANAFLFVMSHGIVGQTEDIIRCGFIKLSKSNQNIGWNISKSTFITAVLGLLHAKIFRNILLRQIVIFSKIFDSMVVIIQINTDLNNRLVLTFYHKRCIITNNITIWLYY